MDALARSDPPAGLVFKGGTALRLCFFEDFRYSADLDFSLVDTALEEAFDVLDRAFELCREDIGLPTLSLDRDSGRISYVGPLSRERALKLDVATDELVIETTSQPLILRYADQTNPPPSPSVYATEEVAAEKLRCVIQRLQCRDISDLHRLLVIEGVVVDGVWSLFEMKAEHLGFKAEQFGQRLESRSRNYERRWLTELEVHLGSSVPHFERVMRELRRSLRDKL